MPVSNNAVVRAALSYVEVNPAELDTIRDLVILALLGPPITQCSTLPAHLACRAVVMTSDRHVLTLGDTAPAGWRFPGGHVDDGDSSLLGAALRQLHDLTGIDPNALRLESALPYDLDAVPLDPASDLGEPEHVHYECRYLLHLPSRDLGTGVTSDVHWVPVDDVPGRLGTKLRRSSRAPAALG